MTDEQIIIDALLGAIRNLEEAHKKQIEEMIDAKNSASIDHGYDIQVFLNFIELSKHRGEFLTYLSETFGESSERAIHYQKYFHRHE